tara:strand:- start:358 stop:996 length:639 start_codon:yes stop_codon:yes gene_type:complete
MANWNAKNEWKILLEETNTRAINEAPNTRMVQTWGELGELLAVGIQAKELEKTSKSSENMGKAAKNLLGLTPFGWVKNALELGGQIKDMGDVFMSASEMNDEKADKSPMMTAFNIDDGYAEILDDRLETEFIKWLSGYVKDKITSNGDGAIPTDLDVNGLLEKFLEKRGVHDETVSGSGTMSKFTDIEYPKDEANWKKSIKAMGKGFLSGLF